jgi:hypothetical protein
VEDTYSVESSRKTYLNNLSSEERNRSGFRNVAFYVFFRVPHDGRSPKTGNSVIFVFSDYHTRDKVQMNVNRVIFVFYSTERLGKNPININCVIFVFWEYETLDKVQKPIILLFFCYQSTI